MPHVQDSGPQAYRRFFIGETHRPIAPTPGGA